MTYEEFKKELYRNLRQQNLSSGRQVLLLEKGCIVSKKELLTLVKLINLSVRGREGAVIKEDVICVVRNRQDVVSMIHWLVRPLYDRFKREGWQGVLPEMVMKMQDGRKETGRMRIGGVPMGDRLIIQAMQYPYYRDMLEKTIAWQFGDIALALYLLVDDNPTEMHAVHVTREMVEGWGATDESLLTNALLNTREKLPPRLYYASETGIDCGLDYGVFMPGEKGRMISIHPDYEPEGLQGYTVTNVRGSYGAVALFYPGVKERLAELLDGDYYVGFTSVHEVVVHPARHKVLAEMKASLRRTNILFEQREVLTDRVYRYSCSRQELIEV